MTVFDLTGRTALVTGGAQGLGEGMAHALAAAGATVVIADLQDELAAKVAEALGEAHSAVHLDVTDEPSWEAAVAAAVDRTGRLDILVNNAGVYLEGEPGGESRYRPSTVPDKVLRATFDANLFAPIAVTQALLPLLRLSPAGRIVNLSSVLGSLTLHSDPSSDIYAAKVLGYNASKTALNAFTVHLAHELKDETTKVNSAHPGWVQTEMGGSAAPMAVGDGAKTSVLLATLPADGPSGGFFHLGDTLPW